MYLVYLLYKKDKLVFDIPLVCIISYYVLEFDIPKVNF